MNLKILLSKDHKGVGGLYFVITNILCSVILFTVLHLSWASQAVAIADNLAYITAINTTVKSYNMQAAAYDLTNPYLSQSASPTYSPLSDFNKMLAECNISTSGASTCRVTWTGRKLTIQIGEFETKLGVKVRPHRQESIIENE